MDTVTEPHGDSPVVRWLLREGDRLIALIVGTALLLLVFAGHWPFALLSLGCYFIGGFSMSLYINAHEPVQNDGAKP